MKYKSEKNTLSLREAFLINCKAIALLYRECSNMLRSNILWTIWKAFTPYVGIYLMSQMIGAIAGKKIAILERLILLSLLVEAVITLVSSFLIAWRDTQNAGQYFMLQQIFGKKLLDMDFAGIDDIKTYEKLSGIEEHQNSGGWGFEHVLCDLEVLFASVTTLLGGVVLTVTLFVKKVPDGAGRLIVLNHPLTIATLILVMAIVTYLAPHLTNKGWSYFAQNADEHRLGDLLFNFFGFLGYDKERAADMRIYRQDKICEKYNNDKNGIFGTKGRFAKLRRGPIGIYLAGGSVVSMLFTGFAYLLVCLKAWGGAFGVGAITQYVAAITKLAGGISALIELVGEMRNNAAFLKLSLDFLETPDTMYKGKRSVERPLEGGYEMEFRHVSFRYPGSEQYVLKDVNIKFQTGIQLAVVGENGSGKTTFIKLICRLYDPTEGEILLNGVNIREFDYLEYLRMFSVVFQDFKLFAFSLGQNIAASTEYDRRVEEICLCRGGFSERLNTLKAGLDTYLYKELNKEGVEISGGEAQKIALARALYKESPFLILDEPTAALDPVAETEIYRNINAITEDKTAIYISHRLSSCRFCSNILVFHEGRLIQEGSHEQLLEVVGGKYFELWNAQAKYYNV